MMKIELSTYQAADLLRADTNANWSYNGALALVEYLEDVAQDTETDINFNVVDIRCNYTEYKSLQDWNQEYFGFGLSELKEEDEIREFIEDHGELIEFDGGIIVSSL